MSSENFFNLFGFEPAFNIDQTELKKRYLNLQKKWHPDLFPEGMLKNTAQNKTILINDAFEILKNDVLRAKYLLELHNFVCHDNLNRDLEYLESQFELKSFLQQCLELKDTQALKLHKAKLQAELEQHKQDLTCLFKKIPENIELINIIIGKLQFCDKNLKSISQC